MSDKNSPSLFDEDDEDVEGTLSADIRDEIRDIAVYKTRKWRQRMASILRHMANAVEY